MKRNWRNRLDAVQRRLAKSSALPCSVRILGALMLVTACVPDVVQHNNTGNERYAKGVYDEAIAEYRQAQLDDPDRAEPYYNAANAYYRQGQPNGAQSQVQQALRTADRGLAASTWYTLGNVHFYAEAWQEAVNAYQQALRIHPSDLDAKHNLELALQKLNDEQTEQDQQPTPDNTESVVDDSSESIQASPTPSGPFEPSEAPDQAPPAPRSNAGPTETITRDQALQLLHALVGDGTTLQEQLSATRVQLPTTTQDW